MKLRGFRDYELCRRRLQGAKPFSFTLKAAGDAIAGNVTAVALTVSITPTVQPHKADDAVTKVQSADPDDEYVPLQSYARVEYIASTAAPTSRFTSSAGYLMPDGYWQGKK